MIGAVTSWGSLLLDVASKLYPDSKDINTAADVAGKVRHSYNVMNTTSVHASAGKAIIAPLVGVEASLLHQEFMPDVMNMIQLRDIVATLTHLAMQGAIDVNVKLENVIGSISPNRGGMMALSGCEAFNDNLVARKGNENKDDKDAPLVPNQATVQINGKSMPDVNEYAPLAVGKTVMATIVSATGVKHEFPLTFRQIPVPQQVNDLQLIFSATKQEDGFFIRLMMAKTQEITYPDFLSGKDIVKERFRVKNEDMSGYYKEALKRETGNKITALRTGVLSMNSMANSFVMSSETARQIELKVGRRFNDAKSREQIFKAVKANTIVVCDEGKGIFVFYTHGQDMAETYTRSGIASKSKKDTGSGNLADLVKLLNGGM